MGDPETGHIIEEVLDSTLRKLHESCGVAGLRDGIGGLRGDLAQWFDGDAYLGGVGGLLAHPEGVRVGLDMPHLEPGDFVNVGRLHVGQKSKNLPLGCSHRVWPAEIDCWNGLDLSI